MPSISFAQSDFEKVLKGGEILVNGLSFFKGNKSSSNSKTIESLCVKNKLGNPDLVPYFHREQIRKTYAFKNFNG